MNPFRLSLFLLLSSLAAACGTSDAEDAAVPPGPAAAFHGVWKGEYRKLDEEGLPLKQTRAKAEFVATEEGEGTFEFRFPEENDSKVKGKFQVFNMTTLILEIEESNYSGIGLSGLIATYDFEINSRALILNNKAMELVFVRDQGGTINEDGKPNAAGKKSIKGRWLCIDKAANTWDLSIEDQYFNVSVSGSGGIYFTMNGSMLTKNENLSAATMLIEKSPSPYDGYVGRSLNVTRTEKGIDVIMTANDKQIDQFTCKAK